MSVLFTWPPGHPLPLCLSVSVEPHHRRPPVLLNSAASTTPLAMSCFGRDQSPSSVPARHSLYQLSLSLSRNLCSFSHLAEHHRAHTRTPLPKSVMPAASPANLEPREARRRNSRPSWCSSSHESVSSPPAASTKRIRVI